MLSILLKVFVCLFCAFVGWMARGLWGILKTDETFTGSSEIQHGEKIKE